MTLLIEIPILTSPYLFLYKNGFLKVSQKLMNCLLIKCGLFSSSIQMEKNWNIQIALY